MQGRLIKLASGSGVWNMAVDQALLESVDETQVPVLRFYRWSRPTLSMGYFQKLADRTSHHASRDADCLRRSTGGGAIMHHHDLTYSLAIPMPPSASGARTQLYRAVHEAFISSLANFSIRADAFRNQASTTLRIGAAMQIGTARQSEKQRDDPFLCFQRRTDEDLIVSGYKILGSAQRRSRRAILQHGSLLLRASPFAPELPGITDLASKPVGLQENAEELIDPLMKKIELLLELRFASGDLMASESERAAEIADSKFGAEKWLRRH